MKMKKFREWLNTHSNDNSSAQLHAAEAYICRVCENDEYEDDDILHFWYLCNEKSPSVKKFVAGLNDLLDECFPGNKKQTETKESELSPLIHRYIRVTNEDAI